MGPGEDEIETNLRRGTLEFCVLGVLAEGPAYGLELARRLGTDVPLLASEGTLYPLLARLRRSGWVRTSWQESSSGPPRRYHHLTSDGRAALDTFLQVWSPFVAAVNHVVKGAVR
jgi:PadR family transcriptional regulator PadR